MPRESPGFGLISLILSVAIFSIVAIVAIGYILNATKATVSSTKQAVENSGINSPSDNPMELAEKTKALAETKQITTAIAVYFSENERYPAALTELGVPGVDIDNYNYQLCNERKAILFRNGEKEGIALTYGEQTPTQTAAC